MGKGLWPFSWHNAGVTSSSARGTSVVWVVVVGEVVEVVGEVGSELQSYYSTIGWYYSTIVL